MNSLSLNSSLISIKQTGLLNKPRIFSLFPKGNDEYIPPRFQAISFQEESHSSLRVVLIDFLNSEENKMLEPITMGDKCIFEEKKNVESDIQRIHAKLLNHNSLLLTQEEAENIMEGVLIRIYQQVLDTPLDEIESKVDQQILTLMNHIMLRRMVQGENKQPNKSTGTTVSNILYPWE